MADEFAQLCDAVEAARSRIGVPGVALGLLAGGETRTACFGVTSVENPLDVDAHTLFQIGSITKTFTGTAAQLLANDGELELDTPVRKYLPELRLADDDVADRVTMRHLLTHTGGWTGDYFDDFGWGDDALTRMVAVLRGLEQLTPLGELWSYNNAGFYIAGRALETVTAKPYEDVIRELVLDPLGLERSFFFPHEAMLHRFAVGHAPGDDGAARVVGPWPIGRAAHAAGGLACSIEDLLRYARFHLEDERVRAMQEPIVEVAGGMLDAMALTWMTRETAGTRLVYHGGTTNGQNASLTLVPSAGAALALLTNDSRGSELIRETTHEAMRLYLGADEAEPARLALDSTSLAAYAGSYRSALTHVALRLEDGALVQEITPLGGFPKPDSPPLPGTPAAPLAFVGEDTVVVTEGPLAGVRAEFIRDAEGRIAWYRSGGRLHRRTR